jgi:hypothetical protein
MRRREPDGCVPVCKFSFSSQDGRVSTGIAVPVKLLILIGAQKGCLLLPND